MRAFSARGRARREGAEQLYASCIAAARQPILFSDYGVPDTLQGRFEMVALHLFPVLNRLMHLPGDDPLLAQLLSEVFVADMDAAFREMGVGDITVPKRMATLYRSFAGRISAYNQAAFEPAPALADAIGRNVFCSDVADERAAALARHLESMLHAIQALPLEDLRAGSCVFPVPALLRKAG